MISRHKTSQVISISADKQIINSKIYQLNCEGIS